MIMKCWNIQPRGNHIYTSFSPDEWRASLASIVANIVRRNIYLVEKLN